jgi:hypothetical protein
VLGQREEVRNQPETQNEDLVRGWPNEMSEMTLRGPNDSLSDLSLRISYVPESQIRVFADN